MGFPHFPVMDPSGERVLSEPDPISALLWKGIHERLFLFESDAEEFIQNTTKIYDMVFVDAYDGDDIFPYKLRDPNSPFLKALKNHLNEEHGTVVVNLHSDTDVLDNAGSVPSHHNQLPVMGRYVSRVCQAYKEVITENGSHGLGFTVSAPWVCNASLALCRGLHKAGGSLDKDKVLNTLISKSPEVENAMNLPFSCLQYIKSGFMLAD